MKTGPELVKAIQPLAGLLNQCLDTNSQFYAFLEKNQHYTPFLKELTKQMQTALQFGAGHYIDAKGKSKNLFGEYLEAIAELNEGNATRLTELFAEPIAGNIIAVFKDNLKALADLNKAFLSFEQSLQAPAVKLDEAFDEIQDVDPMSQSAIFHFDSQVNALSSIFEQGFIDSKSGKPIGELSLDQSFYVGSTSSKAASSTRTSPMPSVEEDDFGFVIVPKTPSFIPGYQIVGKHGKPVSGNDLNQSIRMVPIEDSKPKGPNAHDTSSWGIASSIKSMFGYK